MLIALFAATGARASDPALTNPALMRAKAPAHFNVKFNTTAGTFVVSVTRAWAPNGADRFYNLVKHRFFDGDEFFRVVPGFVVQFGLTGNPAVDSVWATANFPDDPVTQSNAAGYVTFAAEARPDSRTTQLFINLGNNARLDGMGFAPFGRVTSGMETVQKIYSGYGQAPDQAQIMASGNAYLAQSFPRLDKIIWARIQ